MVDSGLKSESIIPIFEFAKPGEDTVTVNIGDEYDLFLESAENGFGETVYLVKKHRKQLSGRLLKRPLNQQ